MLGPLKLVCVFVENAEKSRKFVQWKSNQISQKHWIVSKLLEAGNECCPTFV